MYIADIKIRNFRKLKEVHVNLCEDKTVFIGANNSGKTSALVALRYFLKPDYHKKFSIYDFTISNHEKINDIGRKLEKESLDETCNSDLSLWKDILPTLDIWFNVGDDDLPSVASSNRGRSDRGARIRKFRRQCEA